MRGKAIVPAIRFAGFTDAWEQREFGEMFDCTIPNNTLSRAELSYEDGSVLNIHYGDVLIKYGAIVDIQNDNIPRIPGRSRDDFKGALLQEGDIIIADTAEDETTGKACEIGNLQGFDVVSGLHTMVCRPRLPMALGYLGYYLNADAYHHQLLPLMQGIKVLSLSRNNIQKTMVSYPSTVEEQERIAAYFTHLDHLITLHQRKYSRLCNIKKSMLERMFPKEGASVPEIRFAGFTDAWEQRKLGELTTEFIEYITLSSELPLLTSSRAGLMYQNEYRGNLTTDSKETLFSVVPLGACTYRHMSNDDIFHLNINILEKGLVSREYPVFIATGENDLNFIVQHLNSDSKFRAFCAEQKKGGTRTRLYYKTLCEFSVMVPKSAEQNKISSLLLGIDHLITLHQRKLERLQNIKKSCLEKMFV